MNWLKVLLFGSPEEMSLREQLWYGLMSYVCRMTRHRVVGESYATPDTGGDNLWCDRCGADFSIIYY